MNGHCAGAAEVLFGDFNPAFAIIFVFIVFIAKEDVANVFVARNSRRET
jgi:hypothetical protein